MSPTLGYHACCMLPNSFDIINKIKLSVRSNLELVEALMMMHLTALQFFAPFIIIATKAN